MKPNLISVADFFIQVAVYVWIVAATVGLLVLDRDLRRLSAELVQARVVWAECRNKVNNLDSRTTDHTAWIQQLQLITRDSQKRCWGGLPWPGGRADGATATPPPQPWMSSTYVVKPMPDGGPK